MKTYTDTERLNFLLKDIEVEDIGDAIPVCGVVVHARDLEERLNYLPLGDGECYAEVAVGEDLRTVIDRALAAREVSA